MQTRYELFGVKINDVTLEEAAARIQKMLRSGGPHTVCYANPETLVRAARDEELRFALSRADMVFPDGFGLRLFGRFGSAPFRSRVAGLDLMLLVCKNAEQSGMTVFLLGGGNGVAKKASLVLKEKFPRLRIAGTRDGFKGMRAWEEDMRLRDAHIVFVALGTPAQEEWIAENIDVLPEARVVMAVGGAFDMLSSVMPRAPRFLRAAGLEWVWRFFLEPRKRLMRIINAVIIFPVKIIAKRFIPIFAGGLFLISGFSASAQTYANSDVPLIMPRATWENSQTLAELLQWVPEDKDVNGNGDEGGNGNPNSNSTIPDYAPVERIVIHDTGCPVSSPRCNSDTVDAREVIQSIYRNHAAVRDWGDIGYHYIIDRKGNIYEGRYGGNGARGAHVYDSKQCRNFNVGTIGIAILGNYANALVPEAAIQSLARLVGWLSATNAIDPAQTAKTSMVWANPKLNGKCDLTYGSFSSSFIGPIIVGHNELEAGNSDPGTLDMTRVRREAALWKEKYAGLAYREPGDTRIFRIEGGVIRVVSGEPSQVASINPNQLYLFPEENKTVLAEGTLAKSRTRGDIYRIEDGKRRHITSAVLFKRLGYSLGEVKVLSDRELLGYAAGDPILFSDGTLLASQKTGKTYLITNGGKKRYIVSPAAFSRNKFKYANVIKVADTDLEAYFSDGIVGLPEGTLFSLSPKATAPNYVAMNGGKKLIPSWAMFDKWKFNRKKIEVISKKDFDLYPDNGELLLPDGTLIRQDGQPEMYLVHKEKKHWIGTFETFQQLGLKVSFALALQSAELEKYETGVSVAAAGDWQLIKEGKPVAVFAAAATGAPASAPAPSPAPAVNSGLPIRIGLFSVGEDEKVSVSADADFMIVSAHGGEQSYAAGNIAVVDWKSAGNTKLTAKRQGTIFTIASYSLYNWNKSVNFNAFRGGLELVYSPVSKKVWMVNELPFEDYLAGIAEALDADHPEYQKAFSVAARSYAMFHVQNGGKYGADEVFHLNSGSSDQVYKGYGWEQYASKLAASERQTAGEVMKYNGKIARAVYSSDSGGVTKNACSYFGKEFCTLDYEYLSGGVSDPEGTVRREASVIAASHGVGMSATGARRLAELGKTYKDILAYYYKGVTVEKLY